MRTTSVGTISHDSLLHYCGKNVTHMATKYRVRQNAQLTWGFECGITIYVE
jgi:hypothetical protein